MNWIPVPDRNGNMQFVRDPDGRFPSNRAWTLETLTQIASVTGGVYVPLGAQDQALVKLYEQRLKGFAQRQHDDRQVALYAELFQWPPGAAIVLLTLEWLLGASVRRRMLIAAPAKAAIIAGFLVALTWPGGRLSATLSAQSAYNQGQYAQAQRDYTQSLKADPSQSHLQYNLGAAAYKAARDRRRRLQQCVHLAEVPLQQSAYYNSVHFVPPGREGRDQ